MILQQPKCGHWDSVSLMWGYIQTHPPALFGRMHRIEGGRMTLILRHSSGAWVLGAEFLALGMSSSVVCSVLLRECVCHTMDVSTKGPGADSRRSAPPYSAVGHCVEPWPFPRKYSCTSSSTALCCWSCAASSSGVRIVVAHWDISVPHSIGKPRKHWGTEKQTQSS